MVSGRALCLLAFISCAQAQQQSVVVTATRTPVGVNDAVGEVTVLDRADIARTEARTLSELLSRQAGLQFASNGGLGKNSSVFIRGLEARHTLLLVDGVRVGSATVGSPSLDNLPLEAIERIEIVRGPMSSLYGNGAMGGVVQVFTRRGGRGLSGNAKLAAGSNHYTQAAGGVGFGDGVFDVAAQVQHTDTDGVSATNPKVLFGNHNPDRDGWRQTGGSVRVGVQPGAGWRVELLNVQARGLTRIDDGPGADARARIDNRATALSVRGPVFGAWTTRVTVADALDAYDTLASASPFTPLGATRTKSRQAAWENTLATPVGTALALLERTTEQVRKPGAPYAVEERDIDALALGLDGSTAGHHWQGSLRRDRNSQFGAVTTGALGYAYAVTPQWRAGASYGTSQTLPSFNQLYFPNFGNPNLIPEEGKHAELSLRFAAGEHSVRAAVFAHRYRNFISSGPQPANVPRVKTDGATLAYEGRWRELTLKASLDHSNPRVDNPASSANGKLLVRHARNALRLGGDWDGGTWAAGATVLASSHRFENATNTTRLGGYGTLDLRGEWRFMPGYALALKLNNAGDKRYETALGYDQPGREGFVTLRAEWK